MIFNETSGIPALPRIGSSGQLFLTYRSRHSVKCTEFIRIAYGIGW